MRFGKQAAILHGSPGSGKSSLAKAMAGIPPPMSQEESLQTSKIYSVAGKGNGRGGLMRIRPFRAPHYSASLASLLCGGSDTIIPGEISLAHNGVFFADEFCEAPKRALEALRAPMEDRIDIQLFLKAINPRMLVERKPAESSAAVAASEDILPEHLSEAAGYRFLDKQNIFD